MSQSPSLIFGQHSSCSSLSDILFVVAKMSVCLRRMPLSFTMAVSNTPTIPSILVSNLKLIITSLCASKCFLIKLLIALPHYGLCSSSKPAPHFWFHTLSVEIQNHFVESTKSIPQDNWIISTTNILWESSYYPLQCQPKILLETSIVSPLAVVITHFPDGVLTSILTENQSLWKYC